MVDDKANNLFEKYLERVDPEIRNEVSLNIDIANRIYDLIKKKGMTQREFAALMGKRESEVSRWLSGTRGFTTNTLAKISAVLGEPVVKVPEASEQSMVLVSVDEIMFMMSSAGIGNAFRSEDIQLGFSNKVDYAEARDEIILDFGVKYAIHSEDVLECVCRFKFSVVYLKRFIQVNAKDNSVTITHIMPHLLSVAVGTMRGILIAKTAGTPLAKYPLPMLDINRLNASLSDDSL